jgi:hypothetical protein
MLSLFLQYVLPFLMLILIIVSVALRIHWHNGPTLLFVSFFLIAFGPSLLYALIADASNSTLFGLSTLLALIVTVLIGLRLYYNK